MDLPPEAYTEGDQFHREKTTLFAREWLLFGASAQLGAPGRYLSQTIGGWPVMAIAGSDGRARAFRNLCRHQNMPVVDKAEGECDQLRCRFHGWAYDIDGRFVSAPPMVAPAEPGPERNSLQPVDLEAVEGLLFVRLAEGGAGEAPRIPLDERRFAEAVTAEVGANWKAAAESLLVDGRWRLEWPLAFFREEAGARIIRQVVPRSFTRTRFIDLVFTGGDGPSSESIRAAAERDKTAAEQRQTVLAGGAAGPATPVVAHFRERVVVATQG